MTPTSKNTREQRTICEACGNSNLEASSAVWTYDGTAFCPKCAPPTVNLAGAGDLVERFAAIAACEEDHDYHRSVMSVYGELPKGQLYADLREAAAQLAAVTAENARLREALEPFADAVFNDNGDMTVNHGAPTYDDFVRAYFAARAALSQEAPK